MNFTKLYGVRFGSHLYGTNTPTSDLDLKYVVLPDIKDLLVGCHLKNIVYNTNKEVNVRNSKDDVDTEYIPIQVFAKDFIGGQTYAIELAFSIDNNHADQTFYMHSDPIDPIKAVDTPFYKFVHELRTKFLTSNIKAMMGYVVNQANIYSMKGERLNAIRAARQAFELLNANGYGDKTLGDALSLSVTGQDLYNEIHEMLIQNPKYWRVTTYDIGDGRMMPCWMLLEKVMPYSNTVVHNLGIVKRQEAKYGSRADSAAEDNVDWKAMMHAVRIVSQGIEILSTASLTLPRTPEACKSLLEIKRGEVPIKDVRELIASGLEELKELESTSLLPTASNIRRDFDEWLADWMVRFYIKMP